MIYCLAGWGQKSKISCPGLKSKCGQVSSPSGGCSGFSRGMNSPAHLARFSADKVGSKNQKTRKKKAYTSGKKLESCVLNWLEQGDRAGQQLGQLVLTALWQKMFLNCPLDSALYPNLAPSLEVPEHPDSLQLTLRTNWWTRSHLDIFIKCFVNSV